MRAMTFSSCSPCRRLPRWPDCRNRPKLPTWLSDVHLPKCTGRPHCGKHTATLNGRSWPGSCLRTVTCVDLSGPAAVSALSLGNVEQRPRTLGRHEQQGACSTRWRPPSLFPVLQRSHRHAEQRRKPRLGESSLLSDRSDIGHVDHATVLAALDLAQPIQDLTTHVSLRLSHLPLPFGSSRVCEQACCPQRSSGTS